MRTVAATQPAAADRPITISASPPRNRSTMSALPPPGPPLLASEMTTRTMPPSQAQKPAAASRGNASDRAPDLQRHDGDGHAEQQRDHHAVDHPDPVPGEQLRQGAGVEQGAVAVDALGAEQEADHGAGDEDERRRPDEGAADELRVGGDEPGREGVELSSGGRRRRLDPDVRGRRSARCAISVVLMGRAGASGAPLRPGHYWPTSQRRKCVAADVFTRRARGRRR